MSDQLITRVFGIDPGLGRTGFGVIDCDVRQDAVCVDVGCITTPSDISLADRLVLIADDVRTLLEQHKPDVVAVEELRFAKNVTTGMAVSHARGVVLLQAARCGISVYSYAPSKVKLSVTSSGSAKKQQVQEMVQSILKLQEIPKPDDAADALAVALCHTYSVQETKHVPT